MIGIDIPPMTVVCDLDGVLSIDRARRSLAIAKKWEEYHAGIMDDPPDRLITQVLGLAKMAGHRVVLLTGRPDRYEGVTNQWLLFRGVSMMVDDLLMRPAHDFRAASAVKLDLLKLAGIAPDQILFALDDSRANVEAFMAAGIVAYQWGEINDEVR